MYDPQALPLQLRSEGHIGRMLFTALLGAFVLLFAFTGVGIWRTVAESRARNDKLHDLRRINATLTALNTQFQELVMKRTDTAAVTDERQVQPSVYGDREFRLYDGARSTEQRAAVQINASRIASKQTVQWISQRRSGTVLYQSNIVEARSVFRDDSFAILKHGDSRSTVILDVSAVSANTRRVLRAPTNRNGTIALVSDIPIFPSVFLDDEFVLINTADNTKRMFIDASPISGATTRILTIPDKDGIIALAEDHINGTEPPFRATELVVCADGDSSASTVFDLSSLSGSTVVVMTVQGRSGTIALLSNIVRIVQVTITETRRFPDLSNEGVSSLAELGDITHLEISLCAGGGGACAADSLGSDSGGGGGAGSAIVDFTVINPNAKFDQLDITLGAGGKGVTDNGAQEQGGTGGTTTVLGISSTGFFLNLHTYGGEGGHCGTHHPDSSMSQAGGGGGGNGGPASGVSGGPAGSLGGLAGSRGVLPADVSEGCSNAFPIPGKFRFPWVSGGGGNEAAENCPQPNLGVQGGRAWLDIGSAQAREGAPSIFGATNAVDAGPMVKAGPCAGGSAGASGGPGQVLIRYFVR